MFCGFTGIDTLEQAKEYIERKVSTADSQNRNASSSDMILEQGDFIKGIGDISYLRNILQMVVFQKSIWDQVQVVMLLHLILIFQ